MNIQEKIREIVREIDALCPLGHAIEVELRRYAGNDIQIRVHGCKSYKEATEACRVFGVEDRNKSTYADNLAPKDGRTVLNGKIAPGIFLAVFCDGLPPACRIEKVRERVPKTQTVESGEFIEIERTKVVCGGAA